MLGWFQHPFWSGEWLPGKEAFHSLPSENGLFQHVCFPTHEKGYTFELFLTDARNPPPKREPGPTLQGYVQSNHHPSTILDITCPKPHKPSKIIKFCKLSNLDLENFKTKLSSRLADSTATSDVNTMVDVYNQTLKNRVWMIYCQFGPKP